jgi:outer membrane protein X
VKRILIIGILILPGLYLYSQERIYNPFKVDFGITCDIPVSDDASFGGGAYIEPRYNVNDKLTIGLRLEGVYLSSGNVTVDFTSVDIKSTSVMVIHITGDYYFSTEKVRPFIGVGLGMYKKTIRSVSVSASQGVDIGPKAKTNFGFAPRFGLNIGRTRLAAIYNYTGSDITDFLGIQVGFEIGGGRINK